MMEVERRNFALSLSRPLRTASGTVDRREGTLFRITDDGGTVGLGEATPLAGFTESLSECRDALADAADALSGGDLPEISGAEIESHPALAAAEDAPAARHAVASALLDLEARRRRVPLYRLLGAPEWVRRIPVNGTIGDGTVTHTAQTAASAASRGFSCLKVKVGARKVSEDVARLAAVRSVVDDAIAVRADANGAWTRRQAEQAFEALAAEGVDLDYVEQPLARADLEGLARLRREYDTPVAVDETLAQAGVDEVLAEDAADVLVCKPMALGGPDRVVEAADRADEAGLSAVVTTTVDGVVARTCAVHVAASRSDPLPAGLATADRLATDLGPDPTTVQGGSITVPQDDGSGPVDHWWAEE